MAPNDNIPKPIHPDVAAIVKTGGVYILRDPRHPGSIVVLIVDADGVIHALEPNQTLDPRRFFEGVTFEGPYGLNGPRADTHEGA